MQPGTVLSIHRPGRAIYDKVDKSKVKLPDEKIGELIVLAPQGVASMALITKSTSPINLGDYVRNQVKH
jgi:hypothetical protein